MAEPDIDPTPSPPTATYELQEPTLGTARAALEGFFGSHTEDLWRTLLLDAGLTGDEGGTRALSRLIAVMHVGHPIARLCARSLAVRVAVYERLVTTAKEGEATRERR